MPTTLSTAALERSTYAVPFTFTDDAGAPVTPNSGLTWSLYKRINGVDTVVNSRSNVAITAASTITVVLSGADLALADNEDAHRYVVVQGTYNSSLGTNLPIKDYAVFEIEPVVGVA